MGRKIPGRKHHGVRDPEKQNQQRLAKIKNKINAPPENPDEQHVPQSLRRFMELKEKGKNWVKKPKKKKNKGDNPEAKYKSFGEGEKAIPVFKQRPGETDQRFVSRMHRICKEVIHETDFETKFGVQVERNLETGAVEKIVKQPKDKLEEMSKEYKKDKNKKSKNKETGPRLTKSQKRQLKLKEKKLKKKAMKSEDREIVEERLEFGEIAHAPPTLVKPRRADGDAKGARPGKKELLLKSLLDENKKQPSKTKLLSTDKSTEKLRQTSNKVINKKGKRKDLPNALRRRLDKEQQEIIQAYKELKNKKYTNK